MAKKDEWAVFPFQDEAFNYDGNALEDCWPRLHLGDCEPWPAAAYLERLCNDNKKVAATIPGFDGDFAALATQIQNAWRAYHAGDFRKACELGLAAGAPGFNVANKATGIYAHYLEEDEGRSLKQFREAADRAAEAVRLMPGSCNAHYQRAFNLGRYSQGISIAKALTQGHGGKIKSSLEHTLRIAPSHAEAHTALGMFHAEVISQVGAMVAGVTYGAKKDTALKHFDEALRLHPESAIARMEYGNGLLAMFGDKRVDDATALYQQAADCAAVDAMECLDIEQAKAELE